MDDKAAFQEAKRQIMELCLNAYEEGRASQKIFAQQAQGYGHHQYFNQTKTYKIIDNMKSMYEQMEELLLKGIK